MRSGISLREDFNGGRLRRLARQTEDAARRTTAGTGVDLRWGSRSNAARLGNVTLQIVRDWVMRFAIIYGNGKTALVTIHPDVRFQATGSEIQMEQIAA